MVFEVESVVRYTRRKEPRFEGANLRRARTWVALRVARRMLAIVTPLNERLNGEDSQGFLKSLGAKH